MHKNKPPTMDWNYRVCHRPNSAVPSMAIHEVYYDKDGDICWYSKTPIVPFGDFETELYEDVLKMMTAFDYPNLDLNKVDRIIKRKERIRNRKAD